MKWFQTRASMAAQIKTQATTIGELSALVAKQDGEIKAQRLHIRQVEGQRDAYHACNRTLSARLSTFTSPRKRDDRGRYLPTTEGEAAHA